MITTAVAAALTAGVDVGDAAQAPPQSAADGASAFASALEALFAEPTVTPPVAAPPEAVAAAPEASAAAAGAVDGGLVLPPADPMILFGVPLAAPAPAELPPVDGQQWLRVALGRTALDSAKRAPETPAAAIDVPRAGGESEPAALPFVPAASEEVAVMATAAAASTPEAVTADVATVDVVTPDGLPTVLTAEPTGAQKPVAEASSRPAPPPVNVPLQSPDWNREFAARVSWLVERGEQFASIQLTPEQLGPVEVRLAIREGEASIWFGAAQADTRAAIEQALPRLREMLAASGLALADAGVFQGSPRDPRHGLVRADARRAAGESAEPVQELRSRYHRHGLIDDYA